MAPSRWENSRPRPLRRGGCSRIVLALAALLSCGPGTIGSNGTGSSGAGGIPRGEGGAAPMGGAGGETGVGGGAEGSGGAIGAGAAPSDAGNGTETSAPDDAGSGGAGGMGIEGGSGTFRHPGVLVNGAQLNFLKAKIAAGADPWTTAFGRAKRSSFGSLSYTAHPRAIVQCGSYSIPDLGCSDEQSDVVAAYTHALLWSLTGMREYAAKAVEIMNAWSAVLQDHTDSNAPLQSAWCGSVFPRAAEIIRSTYDGWSAADVARFENMLKTIYLPQVAPGSQANGNWELSMSEATIAIGVFLDDQTTFDRGVALWRGRVPAYIYVSSDGPQPKQAPGSNKSLPNLIQYWQGQSTFVDGLCQETCRDLGHVQLGFAAMIDAAETARIQGVNLYADEAARITAGFEFHAKYLNGAAVPASLCGGKLSDARPSSTWEIGYNEYANRDGLALPNTAQLVMGNRPTGVALMMAWETLTHAEVGIVGVP
jgi:hypothetical protein